jgi:hypothetical protein
LNTLTPESQVAGRPVYYAEWEWAREHAGPLRESAHPAEHRCPKARRGSRASGCPRPWAGYAYLWDQVAPVLYGKRSILDMGGGDGNALPGSLSWSAEHGRDMRRTRALLAKGKRWDLVFSSHSVEHVPAEHVPEMLLGWARLLKPGGELFLIGPHRCSSEWSVLYQPLPDRQYWAPTASSVGNLLISYGLEHLGSDDHCCDEAAFWLHFRRPEGWAG